MILVFQIWKRLWKKLIKKKGKYDALSITNKLLIMEKSKLESLPDKQLIQYLKYLLKIIGNDYTLTTLNSFYQLFDDHETYGKAKAPIGGSLSRLDIEYIYWILNHNDIDDTS